MKQFWQELKYAFYVIVHPFDGFWCIKREGKGSIKVPYPILLVKN